VKLVVGLGNPGTRYADSRHNIGFRVVDELARRWSVAVARYDRQFEGLLGQAQVGGQTVLLLKPATFMNLSGKCVGAVWRFYKLANEDVLVVYDDMDLPIGQLRLRPGGSAGGHKGMADIIRHFGSEEIPRLRIGIGRAPATTAVEYVLSRFDEAERPIVQAAVSRGADAVECWLTHGLQAAMNDFNRRVAEGSPEDERAEGESS